MRVVSQRTGSLERPFEGTGVSVYLDGSYRRPRLFGCRRPCRLSGTADELRAKTQRVASSAIAAGAEGTVDVVLDPSRFGTDVVVDVRTYHDDYEYPSIVGRTIAVDGSGDSIAPVVVSAAFSRADILTGGDVRLWFDVTVDGPTTADLRLVYVSGPTAFADVELEVPLTSGEVATRLTALDDASPTEFRLELVDGVDVTPLTTATVQPDSTGPSAVGGVSVAAH